MKSIFIVTLLLSIAFTCKCEDDDNDESLWDQFTDGVKNIGKDVWSTVVKVSEEVENYFSEKFNDVKKKVTGTIDEVKKTLEDLEKEYENQRKKLYNPDEWKKRMEIFLESAENVIEWSKEVTYKLKINDLADLTVDEFNNLYNGLKISEKPRTTMKYSLGLEPPPDEINWVKLGAVNRARHQRKCASCYAFATAAAVEAQIFKKTRKLRILSPQHIVDCSKNFGCKRSGLDDAFTFMKDNGVVSEKSYPYKGRNSTCRRNLNRGLTKIKGFEVLPFGDDTALQAAVAEIGPIAAGIDAHSAKFRYYSGGVYNNPNCFPTNINHAVLVVGYGTEPDGKKYWLIKNSYGTKWGKNGFGKISRDQPNHCGISTFAIFPII